MVPYEVTLGDEPYLVVDSLTAREQYLKDHSDISPEQIGVMALATFRINSYADYVAIGRVRDVDEEIHWSRGYEAYEMLDWMAGTVYRNPDREQQLRDTERKLGRFLVVHGWAPNVCLETRPADYELEGFIQHVLEKDEINGQLTIPEE